MNDYQMRLAVERRAGLGFIGALLLACPAGVGLWIIIILVGHWIVTLFQ